MIKSKYLGVDIGMKRVGIAITNTNKSIAFPYTVLSFKNKEKLLIEINEIIEKENIEKIVMGNPLNTKGKRSSLTDQLYKIIDFLKENISVTVVLADERYSSKEAHQDLYSMNMNWKKQKKVIDKVAASIILQNYIERNM